MKITHFESEFNSSTYHFETFKEILIVKAEYLYLNIYVVI